MFAHVLRMTAASLALLIGLAAGSASAQTLGVGDPAPPLTVREYVKGQPITAFEKGKPYVVEFWATWCGPCKTSIPHLTELQKKHKDVSFIGVSVFEEDPKAVRPFVDSMGDKMDYRVAVDDVPEGGKPGEGKMAKAWMEAAGQDGIPTAFIVDRDNRIAWIGHPMGMDRPLEQVAAGTWDLAAAKAEARKQQERRAEQQKQQQAQTRAMQALRPKFEEAQKSGDPQKLLEVIDEAIASEPSLEAALAQPKWEILTGPRGDPKKAAAFGNRLVSEVYKDNPGVLNNFAWSIVDPERPLKADADLVAVALKASLRADTLAQGKDAAIADTLAKAYFDSGSAAKALEAQERAIKLAKGTEQENDKDMLARLEQYRKAVKK